MASLRVLQRTEMRMRNGGMMTAKVARESRARPEMRGPVDLAGRLVKPLGIRDIKTP